MSGGVSTPSETAPLSPSSLPASSRRPARAAAAGSMSASGRGTSAGMTAAAAAACTAPAAAGASGGDEVGLLRQVRRVRCGSCLYPAHQQCGAPLPAHAAPPLCDRLASRDEDDEVHGADDELPGTGAYGHGGHAGGGYGPPGGGAAAAAAGAAPWELVKAAGAGLPLTHLGREKAGNAEITPLQVGLAHKAVAAGGLLQACWAVESRKLLPPPAARPPPQATSPCCACCGHAMCRWTPLSPLTLWAGWTTTSRWERWCWQGGWSCVGLQAELPQCTIPLDCKARGPLPLHHNHRLSYCSLCAGSEGNDLPAPGLPRAV